jgi:hypothetical protein
MWVGISAWYPPSGMDGFVAKPVSAQSIREEIARVLTLWEALVTKEPPEHCNP